MAATEPFESGSSPVMSGADKVYKASATVEEVVLISNEITLDRVTILRVPYALTAQLGELVNKTLSSFVVADFCAQQQQQQQQWLVQQQQQQQQWLASLPQHSTEPQPQNAPMNSGSNL